jgi:hypothetical protein
MPNVPKTVFKYEGYSLQSLQNLKRHSVYFASPRQFNDPYDSAITAEFDDPSADELERLKQYFLADPALNNAARKELNALENHEMKRKLMPIVENAIQQLSETFLSKTGVTCFAERNDDLLMWSHYGGRHGGFCLEFRTDYEPFNKLRRVQYVDAMPRMNLCSLIIDNDADQWMDLYCTKFKAWQYEQEWRALHKEAGTLFTYDALALKGIYFGPSMERHPVEMICLILMGQNPDVELWRGHRRTDRFAIEFERFKYTSPADAKRLGLAT